MKTHAERTVHGFSGLPKITGVLGLVFFLLAFVGQGFHSHLSQQVGHRSAAHSALSSDCVPRANAADDSAETCPLCIAMHSAAPASAWGVAHAVHVVAGTVAEPEEAFRDERIAFARLSRPPPSL